MSDPTPFDPAAIDDEILSAHLDGELGADEQAALAAALDRDPTLAARLESLRAAAHLAATPVPTLPSDRVDDLIHHALAAGTTAPNVTDLARVGRRRRAVTRWAAAAAVVVVVALAVPLLRSIADDDGDETADAGDTATATAEIGLADQGGDAADETAADGGAGDTAASEMADAAEPDDLGATDDADLAPREEQAFAGAAAYDAQEGPLPAALGDFADVDELQAAVEAAYGPGAAGTGADMIEGGAEEEPASTTTAAETADVPQPTVADPRCGEALADRARALGDAASATTTIVDVAEAVVAGDPVVVAVIDGIEDRTGTIVVVRSDDCTLVAVRPVG